MWVSFQKTKFSFLFSISGTFLTGTGNIQTPNWPANYPSNSNCEWILGAPETTVAITFEPGFGIEAAANCIYDKLEIFEAGQSIGRFCGDGGDAINAGAFSLTGPVRFEFTSDGSANESGFSLNFEIIQADQCAGVDCSNRGECIDGQCSCEPGFVGENCEVNFHECIDEPCLNGGTCMDGINDFTCQCQPGYEGQRCELDIDECLAQPCQNGGICRDQIAAYTCQCVDYFTGVNCENNTDPCLAVSCLNGAQCRPIDIDNFVCDCVAGFTGDLCELAAPEEPQGVQEETALASDGVINETNDNTLSRPGQNRNQSATGQFNLGQPYGLICIAECYSDGTCNYTGGHCLCQPGLVGDQCDDVFGCQIPTSEKFVRIGTIINFSCDSKRREGDERGLLTQCKMDGTWTLRPSCIRRTSRGRVKATLITTTVLLSTMLSISIYYMRLLLNYPVESLMTENTFTF